MTTQEQERIHEEARKIFCRTRKLPLVADLAVSMAFQKMLECVDAMVDDKENPLDEFEEELKEIIESCGCKFDNPNKDEVNAFIRSKAAKLRWIWRKEQRGDDAEAFSYEKFISDVANAIPKREEGWRPSAEQLKVLNEAVLYFGDSWVSRKHQVLQSLYEDLMKVDKCSAKGEIKNK